MGSNVGVIYSGKCTPKGLNKGTEYSKVKKKELK